MSGNNKAKRNRRSAYSKGHWAEWLAAIFLVCKGYRILALRHRTKLGEIDIIARKRELIAVIEVKARRDVKTAVDAVSYTSQKRIADASDLWLSRQKDAAMLSIRYDIVAICPWKFPVHLQDAF